MALQILVVTCCVWLTIVQIHGAMVKVSDSCKDVSAECPVNSECQAVGCMDKLCVCQNETLPNADKTECLQVVDLGESCSEPGKTCTKRAECSSDGVCVCQSGFVQSDNGKRCKEQSYFAGEKYSLLTESCDDENVFCEDARKQKCVVGKCECKAGNRAVTEMEFFSLPSFTECVPTDFSIGTTVQADKCLDSVVDLGEKCYSNSNCPQNAECVLVGCHKKCKCKSGTVTSDNFQSCFAVKTLGEPCDPSAECGTKYSYCKPEEGGVCTCQPSHFKYHDICKRVPFVCPSCVKEWATLGDSCGGDGVECDDDLVCNKTSTTCGCKDGYRVATLLERKTFFLRGYCIRIEMKIEYSKEEFKENCFTTTTITRNTTTPADQTPSSETTTSSVDETTASSTIETPRSSTNETPTSSTEDTTTSSTIETSTSSTDTTPTSSEDPITTSPSNETTTSPTEETTTSSTNATATSSTEETNTSSTEETTTSSTNATATSSTEETATSSTNETATSSTEETATSSTEETATSSTNETATSSTEETATSSTNETATSSTEETATSSTNETATSSTEETATSSTNETATSSTEETTTSSTNATATSSTEETATSSTNETATSSTEETATSSTEKTTTSSTEETPTSSTEKTTTSSTEETTTSSTNETPTSSTEETVTSSTETTATSAPDETTTTVTIVTTTKPAPINLDRPCTDDSSCPNNSVCGLSNCKRRCVCKPGFTEANQNSACIKGAKLDEVCDSVTVCSVPGSGCGPDGKCHCGGDTPRQTDDGFCAPNNLKLVDESCEDNFSCMTFVTDCANSVCKCMDGFRQATPEEIYAEPNLWSELGKCREEGYSPKTKSAGGSTCEIVKVGDICNDTRICPDHSTCISADGGCGSRCWCDSGYAPYSSTTLEKCVPVVVLGDNCTIGLNRCGGYGVVCLGGTCKCRSGQEPSSNQFGCKPKPNRYYSLSQLGEACDHSKRKYCFDKANQQCKDSVCACKEGKRKATLKDIKAQYTNLAQCRGENEVEGFVPNVTCIQGVIPLVADPPDFSKESGASGALVYVAVPAVVVVAAVLATVLTVLRRRKQRRLLDNNSDCSSMTTETETGFHIPRPELSTMGLFRGDKNWSNCESSFTNPSMNK